MVCVCGSAVSYFILKFSPCVMFCPCPTFFMCSVMSHQSITLLCKFLSSSLMVSLSVVSWVQSGSVLYLCVLRVPASYSNTSFVYLVFIFLQFFVLGLCPGCFFCLVTFCHQLCAWTLYFWWTWFTALIKKAHLLFVYSSTVTQVSAWLNLWLKGVRLWVGHVKLRAMSQ